MKKIALFSMVALAFLFTQCKKNDVKPVAADEGIFISLNANYNGAKTGFDPASNSFVWSNTTEYVNVGGSESGYLGRIFGTGDGSSQTITFSGTIVTPQTDETLYFMYLGRLSHAAPTAGTETGTLDFTNQVGTQDRVTNYHIAVGSAVYTGSTEFSATLEMKTAFARINMSAFSGETVFVHGDDIYATATVNYKTGTISGDLKGYINVGADVDDRFVALIPSTTSETTIKFDSNKKSGSMTFLNGIKAGKFYSADNNGSALSFENTPQIESCKGLFAVDGTKVGGNNVITKMVRFSPGNLQYKPSTREWRFAPYQYSVCITPEQEQTYYVLNDEYGNFQEFITEAQYEEYMEDKNLAMLVDEMVGYFATDDYSPSGTNWIDLFGWGTGDNPTNISGDFDDYLTFNDWGSACGDPTGHTYAWYTPSRFEWPYLLNHSEYGMATVKDVNGIIILPYDSSLCIETELSGYDDNTISETDWNDTYESAGAVFLPAAGCRDRAFVYCDGSMGEYHSSYLQIIPGDPNQTYCVEFWDERVVWPSYREPMDGQSVRLIRDVD